MRVMLLCVVMQAGCFATTIPTPASVYRFESEGFRACEVRLGWTLGDLVRECGRPDAMVPWLGHGAEAKCLLYRTEAHAFAVAGRAPAIAACTTTGGFDVPGAVESSHVGTHTVEAVFGLASLPEPNP